MAETITLPRSGVVLTQDSVRGNDWCLNGMVDGSIVLRDCHSERWVAWWPGEKVHSATREDCIAWLDARVLSLRAALLPADARDRVAKVLHEARCGLLCGKERPPHERDFDLADAVLAALVRP